MKHALALPEGTHLPARRHGGKGPVGPEAMWGIHGHTTLSKRGRSVCQPPQR